MNLDDHYLEIRSPDTMREGGRMIRMRLVRVVDNISASPPIELCHYSVDWYLNGDWKRTLLGMLLEDDRLGRFRWETKFVQLRLACATCVCGVKLPGKDESHDAQRS